ncbi:MAG TPA: hypothetical protein VI454_16705 [Verrucomicrobiae bacterium]|jgi:hypothetical protein
METAPANLNQMTEKELTDEAARLRAIFRSGAGTIEQADRFDAIEAMLKRLMQMKRQ